MVKKYNIIVPEDVRPYPDAAELKTAGILARYFKSDVKFIPKITGKRSADIVIIKTQISWEIKNPTGRSKKSTVEKQFSVARGQSNHLVINSRKTKLRDSFIEKEIIKQLNFIENKRHYKGLIMIGRENKIIDFFN